MTNINKKNINNNHPTHDLFINFTKKLLTLKTKNHGKVNGILQNIVYPSYWNVIL